MKRNYTGAADLTIRFPVTPWPGESREQGFNGLYFFHTANSWVSNVVFENAGAGPAAFSAAGVRQAACKWAAAAAALAPGAVKGASPPGSGNGGRG